MAEIASTPNQSPVRVALLWRGDALAPPPARAETRFRLIFDALAAHGVEAQPVLFAEAALPQTRARLAGFDGVLVWVDPLHEGLDRSVLDPLLRDLSQRGVFVSTHPDVILKMGVKEVLYATRELGWGVDTKLYENAEEMRMEFPVQLSNGGARVLKQNRGNGGQGVWKVEALTQGAISDAAPVRVLHALRGAKPEIMPLESFLARCDAYFDNGGKVIDQPYQARLGDGMIRCYMSGDQVVGYGHQLIKALLALPDEATEEQATPGPRIMHDADAAPFQALRRAMEDQWVPAMQRLLRIDTENLPALWDADFLYGPKTQSGEDTYVLCEINVSSVAPFPDSAAPAAASWVVARIGKRGL